MPDHVMKRLYHGPVFHDRRHAGQALARRLRHLEQDEPVVVALPCGGVPVGYEVSRALDAALYVAPAAGEGMPARADEDSTTEVAGRTVIVVDDGIATGASVKAAAHALRARGADRVIAAAPLCSPEALKALASHVDAVVCLACPSSYPSSYSGLSEWYAHFRPIEDSEVTHLLRRRRQQRPERTPA